MNLRNGILLFFLLAILCTWLVPLLHPVLHYDELSAVSRGVNYPSISEQWELGIKPDGHPPLLQLIIWANIQLAGVQPFLLRLIGVIFGLWTIWEGFKLSLQLTLKKQQPIRSKTLLISLFRRQKTYPNTLPTGLITLLFLGLWWWSASIGYQVRPYSIALPFVLKTWAWVFTSIPTTAKRTYLLTLKIALFAVLCSWIHHFAFLSSLTAGLFFFSTIY